MEPHSSWLRAINVTLGHTVYWIAGFVILAAALTTFTRIDRRRKEAEARASLHKTSRVAEEEAGGHLNPSDDLPPDDR